VRRLRQLEEREQEARRGGAKASEQAAAPAGTPQREEDDPALAEGVRRAARHQEKWARTERRLQQAREASQGRQARQAGQRPGREQEEFGLDQSPPPSPPPSSSDSEDGDDDRGDAGPAAAGRPRAHAAPQQAPQHRSRGGIERLAQAPAKFTHDEQPPVDVEMWLGQVAFYLEVMEARADTDRRRRNLTLLLLDGSARNWWLRKPQAERDAVTSFELLRDAMLARFRPIAARDVAYAKAHRLRQREGQSAQQYFDALTEALAPLSEQECGRYVRANMFINGLRHALLARVLEVPGVRDMSMSDVGNLTIAREAAMAAASSYAYAHRDGSGATAGLRAMEAAEADNAPGQRREAREATAAEGLLRDDLEQIKATLSAMQSRWSSGGGGGGSSGSSGSGQSRWSSGGSSGGSNGGGAQWRPGWQSGPRLSEAERNECRRKGLCFFCKGEGHSSRDCPKRNARGGAQTSKPRQEN